jgi:hypothetical protein
MAANAERREISGGTVRGEINTVLASSPTSPQLSRGRENQAYAGIFRKLEMAFGGWNQVPPSTIGAAVAGQVIMQRFGENLDIKTLARLVANEIDNAVREICRIRGVNKYRPDEAQVRAQIIEGIQSRQKEDDNIPQLIAALTQQN